MTEGTHNSARKVNLEEAAQLVDTLERDLAQLQRGEGDVNQLRADVERLRHALAASETAHEEVHSGLSGLRDRLHAAGDELLGDAIKTGDYIARIGRLLGL
jgi:cell division septum initiation protein DivIVA